MREAVRRFGRRPGAISGTAVLGLLLAAVGLTDVVNSSEASVVDSAKTDLPRSLDATGPGKPLNLLLTRAELRTIVRDYEIRTGDVLTGPIDEEEVIVTAPHELAPMRDVSQDAPGGLAAPFWAIVNPKQAWRILVPIPPKGRTQEAERPAPDPR